jgi:hypothetical protein
MGMGLMEFAFAEEGAGVFVGLFKLEPLSASGALGGVDGTTNSDGWLNTENFDVRLMTTSIFQCDFENVWNDLKMNCESKSAWLCSLLPAGVIIRSLPLILLGACVQEDMSFVGRDK